MFLLVRGLNYSIEFTGGTLVQVESQKPVDVGRSSGPGLDREGIHGAEIQTFGAPNEFVIRARRRQAGHRRQRHPGHRAPRCAARSTAVLGDGQLHGASATEAVGPKVGGELRQKAFLAIFLSFFAVLAYLAYRFEWRFGLAAVVATAHDILPPSRSSA